MRQDRQARYYQFTLTESADITVVLESDDAETVLYLRQGAGHHHRRKPSASTTARQSMHTAAPPSRRPCPRGPTAVEATTYAANETGSFTLTVSGAGDPTGPGPGPVGCEAGAITADGTPVMGTWGTDCLSQVRQDRQARYYQFTLTGSADVTVVLESQDAEPVLYLREGVGITTGATTPGGSTTGRRSTDFHRASYHRRPCPLGRTP